MLETPLKKPVVLNIIGYHRHIPFIYNTPTTELLLSFWLVEFIECQLE